MQTLVQDNCLYLKGEVSVWTVNRQTYDTFLRQCKQPDIQSVDFSGVEKADSACISLLLAALRQGSLKIQSLPQSMRSLAELYEVEEWINA
ncbi:STAS domain-containing protein [Kingella negevensis]|uniref:MlaB-like STAS domain-containing protein n=1 Tax=Kingella negevensis TaxID=1522312 RepID=A0A238TBW2_9NEIS|nr:STAS domain-containing protein [Kingella negevensis]MDK4681306.1 STAS domain-containing protein [Kingella negevensis]MDK4684052.1 STAS domain-containing protein [Kingella negevensis]MDK4689102.1 STAS domain-containing protein [Kingella negevensis]MDK4691362.1 STAS domain-containing protein [Kingella negevensis]MDK4693489.1 STAS domain-containing protein [Kingella negevensis]